MRYYESYYEKFVNKEHTEFIDKMFELIKFDDWQFDKLIVLDHDNVWKSHKELDGIFIDSLIDVSPYSHAHNDTDNLRFHVHRFTVDGKKYMISYHGSNLYFVEIVGESKREMYKYRVIDLIKSLHKIKMKNDDKKFT